MLLKVVSTLAVVLMSSCVSVPQCKIFYLNDGQVPAPNVRPYYKLVRCQGQPERVECDDEQPLPTDKCK